MFIFFKKLNVLFFLFTFQDWVYQFLNLLDNFFKLSCWKWLLLTLELIEEALLTYHAFLFFTIVRSRVLRMFIAVNPHLSIILFKCWDHLLELVVDHDIIIANRANQHIHILRLRQAWLVASQTYSVVTRKHYVLAVSRIVNELAGRATVARGFHES